jgi:hypothetical protein
VLIAFAILAVSLAALVRVFSGGLSSLESARQHATAALVARSVVERIGVEFPLTGGHLSGAAGDFLWRAELRRSDAVETVAAGEAVLYAPYDVTVAVAWRERPLVALRTLRFVALSDVAAGDRGVAAEPAR